MVIAFFHNNTAFLPEIEAYKKYFQASGIQCLVYHSDQIPEMDFEVEWHFMGTGKRKKKNAILIHEYGSLSVPPFAHIKNFFKRTINEKPDFRIFLNKNISKALNFDDNIPFGFRDMGIDPDWNPFNENEKKIDFIYTGSTASNRSIDTLLRHFTSESMHESTLLILSKDYDHLQKKYNAYSNISFKGPVSRNEVFVFLQSSRYSLNFIPNIYPFYLQTSTKFLEYCQVKIPVITTDYEWIRYFENQYGGRYFYLKNDLSNLNKDAIEGFDFAFPDLSSWSWEHQIKQSGIMEFLHSRLG